MRPTGRADQCPQLGGNRTQRGRRLWAVHDPNSVIAVMSAARPLFRRKPKSIRDLATLQKVPTADLDAVLPRIETSSVALPESRSGTCRSPSLAQRRGRRQASHSGLQIRGLPVFTSRLRVRSRARESSGPGDWNAMKLPRRNFLHLAAGAAALPSMSCFAWASGMRCRLSPKAEVASVHLLSFHLGSVLARLACAHSRWRRACSSVAATAFLDRHFYRPMARYAPTAQGSCRL